MSNKMSMFKFAAQNKSEKVNTEQWEQDGKSGVDRSVRSGLGLEQ